MPLYSSNQLGLESRAELCRPGHVYLSLSQKQSWFQRMGKISAYWEWTGKLGYGVQSRLLFAVWSVLVIPQRADRSLQDRNRKPSSFNLQLPRAGLIFQVWVSNLLGDFTLCRFKVASQLSKKQKAAQCLLLNHGCNFGDINDMSVKISLFYCYTQAFKYWLFLKVSQIKYGSNINKIPLSMECLLCASIVSGVLRLLISNDA